MKEDGILVTGGAGYIGSHVVRALQEEGYEKIVVIDNLSKGKRDSVEIESEFFYQRDFSDVVWLERALSHHNVKTVMHFAASADVAESMKDPIEYYTNNTAKTTVLLNSMKRRGVKQFIFSSSGSVYGNQPMSPIPMSAERVPINPYGHSKLQTEQQLERQVDITYVILRYFNAAGAHPSGDLQENHNPETHLIPRILSGDAGINGTDYDTPDGTAIRDYIHVCDIADGHIKAMEYLHNGGHSVALNLGCGEGHSVLEVFDAAGVAFTTRQERRAGDPTRLVADISSTKRVLGWEPKMSSLEKIISTARLSKERSNAIQEDRTIPNGGQLQESE